MKFEFEISGVDSTCSDTYEIRSGNMQTTKAIALSRHKYQDNTGWAVCLYPRIRFNGMSSVGEVVRFQGKQLCFLSFESLHSGDSLKKERIRTHTAKMSAEFTVKQLATMGGRVVRWCWVNFQCRGVLLIWISRARACFACGGCGWDCLDIFSLVCLFSLLSPSLWETA